MTFDFERFEGKDDRCVLETFTVRCSRANIVRDFGKLLATEFGYEEPDLPYPL